MNEMALLLEQLAEQLGTTAEYLWPLLVEQTRINWIALTITSLILSLVLGGVAAFLFNGARKDHLFYRNDTEDTALTLGLVSLAIGIFTTIVFFLNVAHIADFLVPEAATIQRLLESI